MKKTKTISFSTMLVALLTILTVLLGALFVAKPVNAQSEVRAYQQNNTYKYYGYNYNIMDANDHLMLVMWVSSANDFKSEDIDDILENDDNITIGYEEEKVESSWEFGYYFDQLSNYGEGWYECYQDNFDEKYYPKGQELFHNMSGDSNDQWTTVWAEDSQGNKVWEADFDVDESTWYRKYYADDDSILTIYNGDVMGLENAFNFDSTVRLCFKKIVLSSDTTEIDNSNLGLFESQYLTEIDFLGNKNQWEQIDGIQDLLDWIDNCYEYGYYSYMVDSYSNYETTEEITIVCSDATRTVTYDSGSNETSWGNWILDNPPATGVEANIGFAIVSLALVGAMFVVVRRKEER